MRELYGVMAAKGAAGGFVVTSGRFTDDATAFASGRNIKLIDGPLLHGLISQAKNARSAAHGVPARTLSSAPLEAVVAQGLTPSCPCCVSTMTKRKTKQGESVGGEFWGCETYPVCKGMRRI